MYLHAVVVVLGVLISIAMVRYGTGGTFSSGIFFSSFIEKPRKEGKNRLAAGGGEMEGG